MSAWGATKILVHPPFSRGRVGFWNLEFENFETISACGPTYTVHSVCDTKILYSRLLAKVKSSQPKNTKGDLQRGSIQTYGQTPSWMRTHQVPFSFSATRKGGRIWSIWDFLESSLSGNVGGHFMGRTSRPHQMDPILMGWWGPSV